MGAGKSTVSPRVARKLQMETVDLDHEVTSSLGMSVPTIFAVLGEDAFRKEESACLQKVSESNGVVCSLGGGTLTREDNLRCCLSTGLMIYLKGSPEFLAQRLSQSRQTRPLLFDTDGKLLEGDRLKSRVERLVSERESTYERAQITIEIDGLTAEEVATQIVHAIRERNQID